MTSATTTSDRAASPFNMAARPHRACQIAQMTLAHEDFGTPRWHRRCIGRRPLRAGYAVCETHRGDLVPFAPTIDAVVGDPRICPSDLAPVVPIVRPLDLEQLLGRVRHTLSETEQPAA